MRLFKALPIFVVLLFAVGVFAQDSQKIDLYNKFVKNYNKTPAEQLTARLTAKKYLEEYEAQAKTDEDKKIIAYIKDWCARYDKSTRRYNLIENIRAKKVDETFAGAKEVVAESPDDLELYFYLLSAGYDAAAGGNHKYDADSIDYAKKAIELFDAGKPFPGQDKPLTDAERADKLGFAYFMLATLESTTSAVDAKPHFIKAINTGNSIKGEPTVYLSLYKIYSQFEYQPLADKVKSNCSTERLAATQGCKDLNAKANAVMDKMIDALARAMAYAELSPNPGQFAPLEMAWLKALTPYYMYRHGGSDAGIEEFIKAIPAKPLPN